MKIKPPTKVKIGSFVYKVKKEKDLMITSGNAGEHRPHSLEIVIDERKKSKTSTFLHEVVHAICLNYALHEDEDTIERLANGFTELLDSLNIKIDWNK